MNEPSLPEESIFYEALQIESEEDRAAFLNRACAADPQLRAGVEELLQAHRKSGDLLDLPEDPTAGISHHLIEKPGTLVGPYKLREQIGEGGMGVVYLAEQQAPIRRQVALKIIKPGMDTKQVIARFEAERQALALMDHSNIARVLDAAAAPSGCPYFVMELVKGIPISEYCDQCSLTTNERLKLFISVCQAVQHAHQKGIIHRDIKPSNVLIAMQEGKPTPKVIDFGVAKAINQRLTEQTLSTGFAQMLGTPPYMSPEQAEMSALEVDTRSDIYSLGVLLYELLTGTTPFEKSRLNEAGYVELRRIIQEEEPPRPSARMSTLGAAAETVAENRRIAPHKLSQLLRGDLDWIVMKALEKDRTRRYETAAALAADVRAYLTDGIVEACPPSAAYRFRKFARRKKGVLAVAGVMLISFVVASIALVVHATLIAEQRDLARQGWDEAKAVTLQAKHRLYEARLAQARAGRRSRRIGQRFESLRALEEATALVQELNLGESALLDLRNETIGCLATSDLELVHKWSAPGTDDFVFDSQLHRYAISDFQRRIAVRRVSDNRLLSLLEHPDGGWPRIAWGAGFSPDGNFLVSYSPGHVSRVVLVWDWKLEKVIFRSPLNDNLPHTSCFSPDSRLLAMGRSGGQVVVYDLSSGAEVATVQTDAEPQDVGFSPDGTRLAVSSVRAARVQIWDLLTETLRRTIPAPSGARETVWHPDGRLLAFIQESDIHIWDTVSGHERAVLRGHQTVPMGLQFGNRGNVLSSWDWSGTVRLWHPNTGGESVRISGTSGRVSSDGRRMVSHRQSTFELWHVKYGEGYRTLPMQTTTVTIPMSHCNAPSISPDGRWLAIPGREHGIGGVALVDLALEVPTAHFGFEKTLNVLFHPSGRELFTAGWNGLYRWPFQMNGQVLQIGPPEQLASGVTGHVAIDPRAEFLVCTTWEDRAAKVIPLYGSDVSSGRLMHAACSQVAVSPDSRWIATGTHGGRGVKIWNAATLELVETLIPTAISASVYFNPQTGDLLTRSRDRPVDCWRAESWDLMRQTSAWESAIELAISSDGKLLAYMSGQSHVAIQDLHTGRTLVTLEAPEDLSVKFLRFTPDASRLLVSNLSPDSLRMWDLRLLRRQLAARGLDWDAPAYPPLDVAKQARHVPVTVKVDLGEFVAFSVNPE